MPFGARDYDPQLGRWVSKEPLLFGGAQTNLYAYAFNDPVNWLDTDGQLPIVAGFFIGAGVELGMQLLKNGGRLECVDVSDVLVSGAFGLVSGGMGNGLKALEAARCMKVALGIIGGAEIGVAKLATKDTVNQTQGRGKGFPKGCCPPTGDLGIGDFGKAAAIGAVTGGIGPAR